MAKRIFDEETAPAPHPIRPEMINASLHFWEAFDHTETEISAHWVVRLCQEKGGWLPFTREEIDSLSRREGHEGFHLNRLDWRGYRYIDKGSDGRYRVTHEFICRCYASAPSGRAFQQLSTV